ncbi:MAG: GHKL domain-containing protein [Prevotella sp.]|nr:GHKL domain-containing protein [Prevotella sp.]
MRQHCRYILSLLCMVLVSLDTPAENIGVPYLQNYTAEDYGAHSRNYDVVCDSHGTVYVANFEGLLYYDGATWRKIHTTEINRITRVARDPKDRIWIGGYNVFGYLEATANGQLKIKYIESHGGKNNFGEISDIVFKEDDVIFYNTENVRYALNGQYIQQSALQDREGQDINTVNTLKIGDTTLQATQRGGVTISNGSMVQHITVDDGLCSNNVNNITYDGKHTVWGTTDKGIFALEIPSPYTHLTEAQGLRGEVYSIAESGDILYIGTTQGLYRLMNGKVSLVPGIDVACWHLLDIGNSTLMAATSVGLYKIYGLTIQRILDKNCTAICKDKDNTIYVCELDCVSKISPNGQYNKISEIEKGAKIHIANGVLQVETLFGELWNITINGRHVSTLVRKTADVNVPMLNIKDKMGRQWMTHADGKGLTLDNSSKAKYKNLQQRITPLSNTRIQAFALTSDESLWVGGEYGVIQCAIGKSKEKGYENNKSPLYIREVTIMNDSVIWGGYNEGSLIPIQKVKNIELDPEYHSITIYFSTIDNSIFSPSLYRYRINGGSWSNWSTENYAQFNNMAYGATYFEVEAMDLFGNISERASVNWTRTYPFYMRWWAMLLYLLIALFLVKRFMAYRTKQLEKAKTQLESVVEERTAELSTALDNLEEKNRVLKDTQNELIRMERTATAGKLTQGLIDRILNPINYINNFSKLTNGLANDLAEDIEDEKVNMGEDNYDDCMDIIDMIQQNLNKIEEHGVNTTRTLRAMEAMLNNTVGTPRETNISQLCKQVVEVTNEYHKVQLEAMKFSIQAILPHEDIVTVTDPESINKALLALLNNAVYAVTKKFQREAYDAEISLTLSKLDDKHVEIVIHDNGVGMEETIQSKVFDPFFTTKPTSEASGVGLYLVREIIQALNGAISLQSRKDEFCNFLIML